jgi:PST family polysaccharide transporter
LKILCFVGAIQSITALFSNLYLSQGATTKQFKVGIFLRLNTIIAIIIGLRFGIEGVAYGYLVSVLINLFPNLKVAGGLVNLKIMEYLKNIFPELLISVLMAFTVYLFDLYLFNNSTNDFFRLFTGVMFGLTVYITLSYLTKNNSAILIFNYVKPFLRKN